MEREIALTLQRALSLKEGFRFLNPFTRPTRLVTQALALAALGLLPP